MLLTLEAGVTEATWAGHIVPTFAVDTPPVVETNADKHGVVDMTGVAMSHSGALLAMSSHCVHSGFLTTRYCVRLGRGCFDSCSNLAFKRDDEHIVAADQSLLAVPSPVRVHPSVKYIGEGALLNAYCIAIAPSRHVIVPLCGNGVVRPFWEDGESIVQSCPLCSRGVPWPVTLLV